MRFKTCYECPNYHHGGAFGNPRYIPYCGSRKLPMIVDKNNHAEPDYQKIHCRELEN